MAEDIIYVSIADAVEEVIPPGNGEANERREAEVSGTNPVTPGATVNDMIKPKVSSSQVKTKMVH